MKYVNEYRDGALARQIAGAIAAEVVPERTYAFMEFCGGHTHAISRYGIEDLLPASVRMIHGPGCPVCVLPMGRIDEAIGLARRADVTLCTYADLMRVPASNGASLMKAKAAGADIRMIYSPLDAVRIAEAEPGRQVVFLAIGFETTTPPTAVALKAAAAKDLTNFTVLCNHVLTPVAMRAILDTPGAPGEPPIAIEGFVGPAHVSTIIGTAPYREFAENDRKPVVIAGFEPLDVMQAILMLVRQVNEQRSEVENQYIRAVTPTGNETAQALCAEFFEVRDAFEWRGIGVLAASALRLREKYARFDAEKRFAVETVSAEDNPACECGAILRGQKRPSECKLFGTVCTPETPTGPCMVSAEGACAAHWTYGRLREQSRREQVRQDQEEAPARRRPAA
jgi:hydrogenase expression/formation protein HypD